jgi:hypothetical protein
MDVKKLNTLFLALKISAGKLLLAFLGKIKSCWVLRLPRATSHKCISQGSVISSNTRVALGRVKSVSEAFYLSVLTKNSKKAKEGCAFVPTWKSLNFI